MLRKCGLIFTPMSGGLLSLEYANEPNGHLIQYLFMRKSRHKSAQVWHTLSRDHTVLPATHALSTNRINNSCLGQSRSSFTNPGGMEGRVALGTTTVSKQSARDANQSCQLFKPSCLTGQLKRKGYERRTLDLSGHEPRR